MNVEAFTYYSIYASIELIDAANALLHCFADRTAAVNIKCIDQETPIIMHFIDLNSCTMCSQNYIRL